MCFLCSVISRDELVIFHSNVRCHCTYCLHTISIHISMKTAQRSKTTINATRANTEVNWTLRMRVAEVECSRPPNVVNTTWYEDKKSLLKRRIIYQCLPRYRLLSGDLWKECGPRGNWTGRDPVCEGKLRCIQYWILCRHSNNSHLRDTVVFSFTTSTRLLGPSRGSEVNGRGWRADYNGGNDWELGNICDYDITIITLMEKY